MPITHKDRIQGQPPSSIGLGPTATQPVSPIGGGRVATHGSGDHRKSPGAVVGSGARWYVIHTQPHAERRAIAHLERQNYRVFCPSTRRTIRHARKRTSILAPLFPNYLFVQLDLSFEQWRSVNGTYGVVRLITIGEHPAPVPQGVVEHLQVCANQDGAIDWISTFKVGDQVTVCDGPFAALVGTLELLDAAGRVRVLLDLLGRKVVVSLRSDGLAPAA